MKQILFTDSTKDFVLNAFDKSVDEEGYVIEKRNPTQRVLTPDGMDVSKKQFGGIKKGSEIYIRRDLVSLINLLDSLHT